MTDRLERLNSLDVSNLRVEDHGLPMHVAALAILDGAALADASGQLHLDAVRAALQQRLHLAPRLRQVLFRPRFGVGPPMWADDADFDIRQHVRTRAVPAPGGEAELLDMCSELTEQPLSRARPLWEMWLLTGLSDGSVGLFIRLHHVVADGMAAIVMASALFDPAPEAPASDPPPWVPAPGPGEWELFARNARWRAGALASALSRLCRPLVVVRRFRVLAAQSRQLAREGLAPRVSLNRPAGPQRRLLLVRADLDDARTVAHAHGGTVNDVVLAAVAGGARSLLEARGELVPELVLKASVAASTRGPAEQPASGNRVGILLVPLPVGDCDPVRRLAQIVRATSVRKRLPPYQPSAGVLQRLMVRTMSRQRLVNLLVSNLHGPPGQLYFAGAPVLELFQVGVVQGNITISVGALSFAGHLNFDIVGDPAAVPDLAVFAAGLSDAVARLGVRVIAPPQADEPAG
jgi:WS/DGAT/MGAT family acyltransferase